MMGNPCSCELGRALAAGKVSSPVAFAERKIVKEATGLQGAPPYSALKPADTEPALSMFSPTPPQAAPADNLRRLGGLDRHPPRLWLWNTCLRVQK